MSLVANQTTIHCILLFVIKLFFRVIPRRQSLICFWQGGCKVWEISEGEKKKPAKYKPSQ